MENTVGGLIVDVYRCAETMCDTTNGGASSKFNTFTLVDPVLPAVFNVAANRPALKLVRRELFGSTYIHAVPAELEGRHTMFGGNFIYTSDSRFRNISNQPIPIHDRVE